LTALNGVEYQGGKGHKDNFYHTLQVLDNLAKLTDNICLRWSALLHDIGKAPTKRFEKGHGWTFHGHDAVGAGMVPRIFKRLTLPTDQRMKYVQKLVSLHQRPIALTKEEITDSAIRRILFDAAEDIDDLMMLCRSDITTKREDLLVHRLKKYDRMVDRMKELEEKDRLRNWQPPISGEDIMATFGIGPGREIGIIKNAIREAILDGIIPNEVAPAREIMFEKAREIGLITA
jgi:putative nucleotidyltransferase with HDIG domain